MLTGLDRLIEAVDEQEQALRQITPDGGRRSVGRSAAPRPSDGADTGGLAPASNAALSVEDLTVFLVRLRQMKEWLEKDQRLLTVVDDCIHQRVRAMEHRTNTFNVQLALLGALLGSVFGWLISAAQSPTALLQLLLHR
jgi:hypothetical protein